ncbi:uridine-cytidine kinase-like 1 isoform X3 [Callorhinchus milii]|uniref:uridine-cytidine kinase-like 1 isoform X3 n=1 Tax=Callorhinchus milii TaxID=7868 RepID=UPI000457247A|nr:uridine-cytidine kinase-like 1 isoform X3 [Callorhinchus milii]|eukprot:gi/632972466/ref/XP_007902671.1/ PREDICTED: uridine-cytidine kinase-like 1 isoform X3 [Callorhinchus milii]
MAGNVEEMVAEAEADRDRDRLICSGSGEDSLDSLYSRLPLTPSLSPRKRTTSQSRSEPPLLRTSKRTIYTAGRPPWYNESGTPFKEAFVIGLCGGSASGKTTVANKIIEALDVPWVVLLSMDSFYKVLNKEEQELAAKNEYNFDHPDGFDFDLLIHTLRKLKKGKSVKVPVYDFNSHSRRKDWKTVYGANVVIFEGILAFANKELLKLLDMKVFVDTDSDIRLVRRLKRDISERGRDIGGVIKLYNKFVKPAFEQYIEPTVQLADIVVPRGGENFVALDLIVQHVHSQLEKRKLRWDIAALASAHQGQPLPDKLSVLESTPQVRGMHTIIRNKDTSRDEFIFYSKRLMRLLIEHALSFLPLKPVTVETPQGELYEGKRFGGKRITGVSILRAGETMEQALTAVCKDIRLGKILIQTNHDTGEPELHYLRLPKDISEDYVILMDSTVSTGAAAMMAVRVLLDHDVQEDKIFLISLLMAEMGVHSVAYAFPKVNIITTAVDKKVNDEFHIIPGIGNFGDRYFGTDAPSDWYESDEGMDC